MIFWYNASLGGQGTETTVLLWLARLLININIYATAFWRKHELSWIIHELTVNYPSRTVDSVPRPPAPIIDFYWYNASHGGRGTETTVLLWLARLFTRTVRERGFYVGGLEDGARRPPCYCIQKQKRWQKRGICSLTFLSSSLKPSLPKQRGPSIYVECFNKFLKNTPPKKYSYC